MHIAGVAFHRMTSQHLILIRSQHLIALLILIHHLVAARGKKASEEKFEEVIEARSSFGVVANDSPSPAHSGAFLLVLDHFLTGLVELASLAFQSTAIFLLLLLGNVALDSLALAHKVFAVVQPPQMIWIHDLVPHFLDPVLAYSVKLHSVVL